MVCLQGLRRLRASSPGTPEWKLPVLSGSTKAEEQLERKVPRHLCSSFF